MDDLIKFKDFVFGMFLSVITWETWQNIIVSLTIAFLGGFLAAAGKQIHNRIYNWRKTKKEKK
jgi:hypothetical protein